MTDRRFPGPKPLGSLNCRVAALERRDNVARPSHAFVPPRRDSSAATEVLNPF